MEKLFDALRAKHPGHEVRDIKFIVNIDDVHGQQADDVDQCLADAVKDAEILHDASALSE